MSEKTINDTLGKNISYSFNYDPTLLVREKRITNRESSNITTPMMGFDVWNAYEISFLLSNGVPVHCIGKIVYPVDGEYIVESKSLKLYLNSFNMTVIDSTNISKAIYDVTETIEKDLSTLLGVNVNVYIFPTYKATECQQDNLFPYSKDSFSVSEYINIDEKIYEASDVEVSKYDEDGSILKGEEINEIRKLSVSSSLLRSNCKVTHQPDWGTIYINMKSKFEVDEISLIKYLISFRNENHFHEEVVETVFDRLTKTFAPEDLIVCAKYTRRGGIDINPIRVSHKGLVDSVFAGRYLHNKTSQQ